jgi:beta-lactam-binding protein with PASTA domain
MSSLFEFLKSKLFFINLGIALVLIISSLIGVYYYLDNYTHHDEKISVPDLRGLMPEQVQDSVSVKHLQAMVVDSSLYDPKKPKRSVLDQDPAPGSYVKENRTIYLSINKEVPAQVKMPDLVDASYRQAEALLQSYGLVVGQLIYKPDMAKNAVLGQQYHGREIQPGTLIARGSKVDLVLGDGLSNTKVEVPNLVGLTLREASDLLASNMLNRGGVIADESVQDTLSARVYRQLPAATGGATIGQGGGVDLFITQNPARLPQSASGE